MPSTLPDLIERAMEAGKAAHDARFAATGDAGAAGFVSSVIPVDALHKPLIRELAELGYGAFSAWWGDYEVPAHGSTQSMEVQRAGCEAFAAVLRDAGFDPTIREIVD